MQHKDATRPRCEGTTKNETVKKRGKTEDDGLHEAAVEGNAKHCVGETSH